MNFKATLIFLFISVFLVNWVYGQKENNNWYFGTYAGITFNNGGPEAIAYNPLSTKEGTVSVSDSNGVLLFYSDGIKIFNRNHIPMKNGTGLMGHESATQSVLAVPKPGSPNIYYIFTVDAFQNNLRNGLRYSILDMSLDGGKGDISNKKNILLEQPVTEKLIAVRHANDDDYWIICHKWNSSEFLAYQLSRSGLLTQPVISNSGSIHGGDWPNAIGQMKANKKATKLALAIGELGKFELFDFNSSNGIISNSKTSPVIYPRAFGVEFSEDGTKLYGSSERNPYLYQFNLGDSLSLGAVQTVATGFANLGALQIGPDNKIYCIEQGRTYLGVINNPNTFGSGSNYSSNGVNLKGYSGYLGLPNMIVTARKPKIKIGNDTTLCEGEIIILGHKQVQGYTYLWQDGSTQSTYKVTKPGNYILKVSNGEFEVQQEINVRFKDCSPFIPNVITPNGDGLNDAFKIRNLKLSDYHLQIFNRWGTRIFESKNYQNDWDGRNNSNGVYYYLLRHNQNGQTYKGWLEVVK